MTPLTLNTLAPWPGSRKRRRRVGRGNARRGTYSGRGLKGQRSRTGGRRGITRRSLRSLMERVPKSRGFKSRRDKYTIIGLTELERHFRGGETVTPKLLQERKVVADAAGGLKVLGQGSLTKALTVQAHAFSASAKSAIAKAGGTAIVIGRSAPRSGAKE